ncbi:MAG: L-2-hydroxyglutarate oxidase [Zoogloeaceae bacterium]|jgi:L-2-hydroxyglutarate oxidase LhgO|nr:L-2-hydroxyglutarate oxidase [Zoogloeaceae bacterium]
MSELRNIAVTPQACAADFLVIGAGVLGLSIACALKRRLPQARVDVLEKERAPGLHSSGRNSGVLHSGLYYPPGSLKARLCRQGALEMARFHEVHGLRLQRCGKLLVPTNPAFAAEMATLAERAQANGVRVETVDEKTLARLEPETRSATGTALWVPNTAVGSPAAVMTALVKTAQALGVGIRCDAELVQAAPERQEARLRTGELLRYGHLIAAAGLHADRVAHLFGVGLRYHLLPFRGLYWQLAPASGIRLNHLIYPVPDLRILYLGVHTTTATDGGIYLGPTAVPAFGRAHYQGWTGISWREAPRMIKHLGQMIRRNQDGFRVQAWQEGRRYRKANFTEAARTLLPRLKPEHLLPAPGKTGLHPRIFDSENGQLLKDFTLVDGPASTHILGAVSPAWTCAFPLARHICDRILGGETECAKKGG